MHSLTKTVRPITERIPIGLKNNLEFPTTNPYPLYMMKYLTTLERDTLKTLFIRAVLEELAEGEGFDHAKEQMEEAWSFDTEVKKLGGTLGDFHGRVLQRAIEKACDGIEDAAEYSKRKAGLSH